MTFKKDHRQSNPQLHELYVGWAMKFLREAQDFCDSMFSHSNSNASELATPVKEKIAELISEDAAFHDAAARLFAGQEPPEEEFDGLILGRPFNTIADHEAAVADAEASIAQATADAEREGDHEIGAGGSMFELDLGNIEARLMADMKVVLPNGERVRLGETPLPPGRYEMVYDPDPVVEIVVIAPLTGRWPFNRPGSK